MKTRIFALMFLLAVGVLPIFSQEIVQGFYYKEELTCPVGERTSYWMKRNGEGGNIMTWICTNESDYSGQLYPIVSVDGSEQSYDRLAMPTGSSSVDGEYEVTNTSGRKEPFVWNIDFRIEWVQYAESVVRDVHMTAYANDWIPIGSKSVKKMGKKEDKKK